MRAGSWRSGVSPYQWLVLLVAWLGWVFDSMDSTIYALVLHPALENLLPHAPGGTPSEQAIGWYGGIIFSVFLIGWALGGVSFGVMADRLGRTRTLIVTILVYAIFTGFAALAHTWWELALYRFLTALGIGGEWAAGAALVAEVPPPRQSQPRRLPRPARRRTRRRRRFLIRRLNPAATRTAACALTDPGSPGQR